MSGPKIEEEATTTAEKVVTAKTEINDLASTAEKHLTRRLAADEPNRLAAFKVESEIIEYLKRVYYFAKRIAKDVLDNENELSSEDATRGILSEAEDVEHRDVAQV